MIKKKALWPVTLIVLVALVGGGVWIGRGRAGKDANLDPSLMTQATRGDLEVSVTELGKIQPREQVAVKSKVAGQAMKVLVDEGYKVKNGDLLVVLDPIDYQRQVTRAQQDVQKADAAVELAVITLDRRRRGLADRGVAQADVEIAENDLKQKRIALQQAREQLATAADQLRFSRITSPLDGTVTQRTIQPGETVVPGIASTFDDKSLMIVADLSVLIAKAELNQIDVAKVRLGQKVTLLMDALPGKTFTATVTKIAPASVLPKGKDVEVFPVEATLDPKGTEVIKPGMTADVKIHVETRHDVLKLPIEAVVKEKGKSYAYKIGEDADHRGQQKADKVEVQVGVRNDRDVEILGGLAQGDKVQIRPASAEANEFK